MKPKLLNKFINTERWSWPNGYAILQRSASYYELQAGKYSPNLGQLISDMFLDLAQKSLPPEFKYQTCDLMLSLQRKTPKEDFEKACLIAIENRGYTGKFLQNVIANLAEAKGQGKNDICNNPESSDHENMRGNSYYK